MIFISQFTFPKLVLKKKIENLFCWKKFLKKFLKFFFALNDLNLWEIQKEIWALSFIAVVFVEFAVVFMNSTANMTKTTAMDTHIVAVSDIKNKRSACWMHHHQVYFVREAYDK